MSTDQTLLRQLASDIPSEDRRFYRKADDVAARIRQLMERRGLTQSQLAERMDKSDSYVSRVLSGGVNLTLKTIAAFEEALKASVLALPEPRERGPRRPLPGPYKTKQTFQQQPRKHARGVCVSESGRLTFNPDQEVKMSVRNMSPPSASSSSDTSASEEAKVADREEMAGVA